MTRAVPMSRTGGDAGTRLEKKAHTQVAEANCWAESASQYAANARQSRTVK